MISTYTEAEKEIATMASKEPDKELCGVLVLDPMGILHALPIPNVSTDPAGSFVMEEVAFMHYYRQGTAWGVWHTHAGIPLNGFSDADKGSAESLKLPQCLFEVQSGRFYYLTPSGFDPPILGRPWCTDVHDCYSLMRDAFKKLLDVDFPDLDRRVLDTSGALPNGQALMDDLKFEFVHTPALGRLCLIEYRGIGMPNHVGLLVSENRFLHHLLDNVSRVDLYSRFWQQCTNGFLRHDKVEAALKAKGYTEFIPC